MAYRLIMLDRSRGRWRVGLVEFAESGAKVLEVRVVERGQDVQGVHPSGASRERLARGLVGIAQAGE